MTGFPTWGKMSMRMRPMAMKKPARMAINATISVSGRLKASSTKRMSIRRLQERLQVAPNRLQMEKSAPHIKPRDGVVDLCLHQEPLRLGKIVDRRESRLVACIGLGKTCLCRPQLDRSVLGDGSGSSQSGCGLGKLFLQCAVS